jgi:carbamoyltransferase
MASPDPTYILGISGYYHDAAAALLKDGEIVAAAQEERFTRKRHDPDFPARSIEYCLQEAGIGLSQVDHIVFYEKPYLKFERLLETYLAYAPKGIRSFIKAMPVWLKEKLYLKKILQQEFLKLIEDPTKNSVLRPGGLKPPGYKEVKILFTTHHQSHAASAFFPSPFEEAAVLCMDGVGEWATTSLWHGKGHELTQQWELKFPHSLGMLYSAFTYYTGFKVNSAEYKVMGLAPYGEPKYADVILKHLIDLKDDGSFRLNMDFFGYASGLKMTNRRFDALFGGPPRREDHPVTQREMDLARSVQEVTEEVVLRLARQAQKDLGVRHLCLAGGVALNCVANGRIQREKIFDALWIQPAAGDAGGALGAALAIWHQHLKNPRRVNGHDQMRGTYLGPRFPFASVQQSLLNLGAVYQDLPDAQLFPKVAGLLQQGKVVGWFQGRMEFGPRALGNRSILGDPRDPQMQKRMNLKIKNRESFRPFAPAILAEKVSEYFDTTEPSPYMLLVSPIHASQKKPITPEQENLKGLSQLLIPRSTVPAVTHVDDSARVQTVHAETNPRFHTLIKNFAEQSGCPVLINTSFNVRGEPIVCTPEDAYHCFMATQMDYLVVENFLLEKEAQPDWDKPEKWQREFAAD